MSLEEKQQFLVEEIINKAYDSEDFTKYMDRKKENGGQDLDIWQMDELRQAVYDYQKMKNAMMQIVDDDIGFKKKIDCQKLIGTEIGNTNNVLISIENFDKKDTGFFSLSKSYVNYKIVTQPFQWAVTRRYSDFEWLREILTKQYPGVFVPPIANKTPTRQFSDAYLIKRMKFLEKFLNHILNSTILKNDKYFCEFLRMQDEKEFKSLQTASEKVQKTTKLDKVTSETGSIEVAFNPQTDNYIRAAGNLMTSLNLDFDIIMKQSKKMLQDFEVVSATMFQMGESFEMLTNHINQFNQAVQEPEKILKFEAVTITLNNMMMIWGRNFQNYVNYIQDNFRNFFKYHDKEISQLKEHLLLRQQSQSEYLKYKERLDLKKEKFYQLKEFNKWEVSKEILDELKLNIDNKKFCLSVMLPKETSQQNDLRDTYAYYNLSAYNEIKRVFEQNIDIYAKHFIKFADSQANNLTQMHVTWADIQGNLKGLDLITQQDQKVQIMQQPKPKV
ncbi:unnamed protein product [Paramecium primaurelia]|uniref:PX domain-containing protein n=1 Tax=Paramecium primaurelia TaxID=5886 RepID=A0A8S1JQJ0_PARPR|nr:unnamed protein product [Paramecium primaurelia]